jgi:hypothetical protein
MLNVQSILVTTFVFAVTFLVPAIVWITLIAGLIQLIYTRVYRLAGVLSRSRKLAHRSAP